MSIKRILGKPVPEKEKRDRKLINSNLVTHERISMLADVFDVNKTQIVHNIVQEFLRNYETEIKEQIDIKRNQLDNIF
ncbi:hypothetical protein [Galbibacter mesophilus]|uniref:hypothetical protein n=1 Tax=Galbibacter mesophilus TaxID=379069 RepID=UPI00191DF9D7|nr:hypothetical protein [Galbibacter mesophilus]MCM5664272.1 hypothetical protein [Galbibacter mesophilus]